MPNIASDATKDQLRELIEWPAGQYDASLPPSFTHAMQSLYTAVDHDDVVLMRSRLNEALEALQQAVKEAIQKRLGGPHQARLLCRRVWDLIRGCPRENWDDLGSQLESRFDAWLKTLVELRDGPVQLLRHAARPSRMLPNLKAISESWSN